MVKTKQRKIIWVIAFILAFLALFSLFFAFILVASKSPLILSASVYPEKVMPGQAMLIRAEIKDSLIIKNAKASIETDDLPDAVRLLLVDGSIRNGKYERVWIAHDTSSQKWYNITITATNIFGKTASIIIPYQDPTQSHNASEIVGGTFTGNYTFSGGDISIGRNLNVTGNATFNGTGSMIIPVGTTAQRPGTPTTGMVRLNTNSSKMEVYNGYEWTGGTSFFGTATGGTITTSDGYKIHTFTSNGTFTVTGSGNVEVLVVAGGGGGGNGRGGGGGAGGLVYNASFTVTTQAYTVTVGTGGAAQTTGNTVGNSGSGSVFSTITAIGGGYGGSYNGQAGGNGGSGGGGGGAAGVGGTGSQGYNGGVAWVSSGAGGGGNSQIGANSSSDLIAGNGGAGTAYSISGASVTYAGGGGGATDSGTSGAGAGGLGGGGAGNLNGGAAATSGTANTGGGGGGSYYQGTSGAGGSGIVIIRYLQ